MSKICQILHDVLPRMEKIWPDETIPGYFVKKVVTKVDFSALYMRGWFSKRGAFGEDASQI